MEDSFTIVDREKLVRTINQHLAQDSLELGEQRYPIPGRAGCTLGLGNRYRELRVKNSLSVVCRSSALESIGLPIEFRRDGGYVVAERWVRGETDSQDPEIEETIRLYTKRPLEFDDGIVVPKAEIVLTAQESWAGVKVTRDDYRLFFVGWKGDDFSQAIPEEWFLRDGVVISKGDGGSVCPR